MLLKLIPTSTPFTRLVETKHNVYSNKRVLNVYSHHITQNRTIGYPRETVMWQHRVF